MKIILFLIGFVLGGGFGVITMTFIQIAVGRISDDDEDSS
ncbi:MAG: DUF3789 domain-containing protein [Clostridium sp.]|nr:DUF3789 domain-containing protein [Clostridium sp.]